MGFTLVHSNTKNVKSEEFVNLMRVTYAQPIPLPLNNDMQLNLFCKILKFPEVVRALPKYPH